MPGAHMQGVPGAPVLFHRRAGVMATGACRCSGVLLKSRPPPSRQHKKQGGFRSSVVVGGVGGMCVLLQTARGHDWCWLFSASGSPRVRVGRCQLRDGSTQHVHGKQLIFYLGGLTGRKKRSLKRSTNEVFTEMKKIHNGCVCEASLPG